VNRAGPLGLAVLLAMVAGCGVAASPLERGLSLYDQGYYAAALAAFDEAVHHSPRSSAAWTNRGVARIRLGDTSGAIEDFSWALALTPDDPELLFNRGNAHVAAGDMTAAIADFTRALEVRPDFARAAFNRGIARSRVPDPEGARADWLQAVALEPDPRARAAMARAAGLGPVMALAGPADASSPAEPARLSARELADRGLDRELSGDRPGALADLRAALALESDPDRRVGIQNLLRLLEGD
jgi:tetratricopeptide (TPR) repeat protein